VISSSDDARFRSPTNRDQPSVVAISGAPVRWRRPRTTGDALGLEHRFYRAAAARHGAGGDRGTAVPHKAPTRPRLPDDEAEIKRGDDNRVRRLLAIDRA